MLLQASISRQLAGPACWNALSRPCKRSPLMAQMTLRFISRAPTTTTKYSRKAARRAKKMERRQEKKELQAAKHEAPVSNQASNSQFWSGSISALQRTFAGKLPGTSIESMNSSHYQTLAYRLPFFLALCYLATSEDTSPFVLRCSLGPSMLPTIHFIGDIWLVSTGAWYKLIGWKPEYQVGDIVLWQDPVTQQVSCKRIVGVSNDHVRRYGEYAHYYQDRPDNGIIWPQSILDNYYEQKNNDSDGSDVPATKQYEKDPRRLDPSCLWDKGSANSSSRVDEVNVQTIDRKIQIPPDHVWLEGDCPLFSVDSRHYGPIPEDWIRGRLVSRVWPLQREDGEESGMRPRWINPIRPAPFPSIDGYLGKQYNFYRVPKQVVIPETFEETQQQQIVE